MPSSDGRAQRKAKGEKQSDPAVSYNEFKEFEGRHYTGVKVGRGSDLEEARRLGTELIELAIEQGDTVFLVGSHFQLGSALLRIGEFESALDYVVRSSALYDPGQHRYFASYYGCDFGVLCSCFASHASWHLGMADEALAWMEKAQRLAAYLDHPFSRTVAAAYESMLDQFRGDARASAAHAREAVALSRKHGFPYYEAWGTILRGWSLAERGRPDGGIAVIREGLAAMEATGAALRRPYYLSLLAQACGRAGPLDEALDLVSDALSIAETTGEHWRDADFLRIRGELLLAGAAASEPAASEAAGRIAPPGGAGILPGGPDWLATGRHRPRDAAGEQTRRAPPGRRPTGRRGAGFRGSPAFDRGTRGARLIVAVRRPGE